MRPKVKLLVNFLDSLDLNQNFRYNFRVGRATKLRGDQLLVPKTSPIVEIRHLKPVDLVDGRSKAVTKSKGIMKREGDPVVEKKSRKGINNDSIDLVTQFCLSINVCRAKTITFRSVELTEKT